MKNTVIVVLVIVVSGTSAFYFNVGGFRDLVHSIDLGELTSDSLSNEGDMYTFGERVFEAVKNDDRELLRSLVRVTSKNVRDWEADNIPMSGIRLEFGIKDDDTRPLTESLTESCYERGALGLIWVRASAAEDGIDLKESKFSYCFTGGSTMAIVFKSPGGRDYCFIAYSRLSSGRWHLFGIAQNLYDSSFMRKHESGTILIARERGKTIDKRETTPQPEKKNSSSRSSSEEKHGVSFRYVKGANREEIAEMADVISNKLLQREVDGIDKEELGILFQKVKSISARLKIIKTGKFSKNELLRLAAASLNPGLCYDSLYKAGTITWMESMSHRNR
jgi:hypothetical protein